MAKSRYGQNVGGLQGAAKGTVDANSSDIGEKLSATLKTLIKQGVTMKENQELKLQILRIQRDLRVEDKSTKLSAKILKEYHEVAEKVQRLQHQALTNKVGKALKEGQSDIATREHMAELLEEIRDRKAEQNGMLGKLGGDLQTSLISFLGPGAPLVHTFLNLKREYGEDVKRVGKWLGVERIQNMITLKRLDDGNVRERLSFGRIMESTKKSLDKIGSALGSRVGQLLDWFKGSRMGKGIGRVGKGLGRILGKGAGGLGRLLGAGARGAGGLLKGVGKLGLRALGPAAGAVGLADIFMNSVNKGKTGEGALGDYAQGALSGASIGAFAGPIGMAVGAALGLAATAITRNWDSVKDAMSKGWDKVSSMVSEGWKGIVAFKDTVVGAVSGMWDSITKKAEAVVKWLSDNVPGFDAVVQTVKQAATDPKSVVATAAGAVLPTVQKAADAVSGAVGGGAVGGAIGAAAQGVAAFTGKLAHPGEAVGSAIKEAAAATGVSEGYLLAEAQQESGFNPNAKAGTSSAGGLFQFTDGTWKEMVKKYGAQYGIGINDKFDAKKNAIMGALFARDNAKGLAAKGLGSGPTEMYAAHFLGLGGAQKLLSAMKQNPSMSAAQVLPDAAQANKSVFFNKDGSPRTVAEVYQFLENKVGSKAAAYSKSVGEGGATATGQEQKFDRVASQSPGANVTVAPSDKKANPTAGSGSMSTGTTIKDMPFAVGPTPFLVMQSSQIG